jgi:Lsr2
MAGLRFDRFLFREESQVLLTIDSEKQKFDDVLRVVSALYNVPVPELPTGPSRAKHTRPPRASAGRRARGATPVASEVRAWARENGRPVNTRGMLPRELLNAYRAAH